MHDAPRQKLRELIIEYGCSLCDDPRRCEALLKDYCPGYQSFDQRLRKMWEAVPLWA